MKAFECMAWVSHFWYELQLLCSSSLSLSDAPLAPYIPDDVVVNILARLPVESVLQCRRVCKNWCILTLSSNFAELHMKQGALATRPSLFMNWAARINCIKVKNQERLEFRVFDDHNKREIVKKVRVESFWNEMAKFEPTLLGSCDGLLLFVAKYHQRSRNFPPSLFKAFILNPVTEELVIIQVPFEIGSISGIYRGPSTNEYRVVFTNWWHLPLEFYRASLKSMDYERIHCTTDYIVRAYYPSTFVLNGSLHWLVDHSTKIVKGDCKAGILVFNTKSEEIYLQPHPGSRRYNCRDSHGNMTLVATTENLWLFKVLDKIEVWLLRDYDSWTWDSRNSVSLNWPMCKFPYFRDWQTIDVVVVAVCNNVEVLICWTGRGMFWYNLENHTVRRASVFKDKASSSHFYPLLRCAPYIKTFARINPANGE